MRKRSIEGWRSWVLYVMKRVAFGGRCHCILFIVHDKLLPNVAFQNYYALTISQTL